MINSVLCIFNNSWHSASIIRNYVSKATYHSHHKVLRISPSFLKLQPIASSRVLEKCRNRPTLRMDYKWTKLFAQIRHTQWKQVKNNSLFSSSTMVKLQLNYAQDLLYPKAFIMVHFECILTSVLVICSI